MDLCTFEIKGISYLMLPFVRFDDRVTAEQFHFRFHQMRHRMCSRLVGVAEEPSLWCVAFTGS